MEKLDPYPLLMQMWNNAVTLGNTLPVSQKLKNKSTTWTNSLIASERILTHIYESTDTKRLE